MLRVVVRVTSTELERFNDAVSIVGYVKVDSSEWNGCGGRRPYLPGGSVKATDVVTRCRAELRGRFEFEGVQPTEL